MYYKVTNKTSYFYITNELMSRNKITSFFLFLLLFVFLNNKVSRMECAAYSTAYTVHGASVRRSVKTDRAQYLSYNRPVAKSSFKSRYMGGEYSFDAVLLNVNFNVPAFIDGRVSITHCFFIPGHSRFSFTLRGPPAENNIA